MTRRLRHWLRCPTCGGRFGRHDLTDFLGDVPDRAVSVRLGRQRWDRPDQDRGTSG